jgi:protein-tyrosine-phosphatase
MFKVKVLFVCVENSCRSQMAEGFARTLGKDALEAWSAGSRPSGKVNETALRLMKEKGIDLGQNRSKGLADLPEGSWDYVITMGCGDACPFVPARAKQDWNIPDPKALPDSEFRKVRDRIEEKIQELVHAVIGQAS